MEPTTSDFLLVPSWMKNNQPGLGLRKLDNLEQKKGVKMTTINHPNFGNIAKNQLSRNGKNGNGNGNGNGKNHDRHEAIKMSVHDLLTNIGEDPEREGLLNTPDRIARMYDELTAGYHVDTEKLINGALFNVDYDEMVIVKDIEFYSLCEHHMLPFFGRAHVAYIPDGKVIGLSKIPRIVEMFARRLQVQERMTKQIADFIKETIQPKGVAVVVEGVHMCSMMRGVKKAEASMITSAYLDQLKNNRDLRTEFIDHINSRRSMD